MYILFQKQYGIDETMDNDELNSNVTKTFGQAVPIKRPTLLRPESGSSCEESQLSSDLQSFKRTSRLSHKDESFTDLTSFREMQKAEGFSKESYEMYPVRH